jgi:hypothetical protein
VHISVSLYSIFETIQVKILNLKSWKEKTQQEEMLWALIVLLLITVSIPARRCQDTEDEQLQAAINTKELNFKPLDDGLPWPLLDFGDITLLMTHAVHCIEVVQTNKSDSFHHIHQGHCRDILLPVLHFFQSNLNYQVPAIICEDFRSIAFPNGRIRRGKWRGWRGKRSVLYLQNANSYRITQDDKYNTIAARNFGDLIKKEAEGKLTLREQQYMAQTKSPVFIRMAALGLYCRYEAYLDVLKAVLEGEPNPA